MENELRLLYHPRNPVGESYLECPICHKKFYANPFESKTNMIVEKHLRDHIHNGEIQIEMTIGLSVTVPMPAEEEG